MLRRAFFVLRIYLRLQVVHLRTHLEYEADFWISILGMALTHGAGFVFIWTIFQRIPDVAGWTLWEIAFLYALAVMPRGLVEILCDGQWTLRRLVNRGEFDRLLLRPISPALQVITQIASVHGFGSVLLGAVILLRAASELNIMWGIGQVAFLLVTLVSSVVILGSINYASNCIAFWDASANSAFPFLAQQPMEFIKFPLSLYGRLIQVLLTWVLPFGFVSYYPGLVLLDRPEQHPWLGYGGPVAAAVTALIAAVVWHRGLRRYQGVGN